MKRLLLAGFSLIVMLHIAKSQVTERQVRPIDSAYVINYLQFGNFHTVNSHPVVGGDNIITWDHGSGLYQNITGYYVGWSNTDRVDESTASQINETNGQSYKTFNLNGMQDVQSYEDSLSAWFSSIGIPVNVREQNTFEYSLFPNPVEKNTILSVNVEPSKEYTLSIYDVSGRFIKKIQGVSDIGGVNVSLGFSSYTNGVYIVEFQSETTSFCTKVLKK
ncbi:MAG: hypothetical protein CVT92_09665 [Bacteroidetes bacterium HGW-Bacteroidetes-1]|jgi:hypothetical protein|nr:MAG: hypothetical protein CVT92_09665 [Bacteroidetes bacterium HGW-Bacteroidetes-1]